MRRLPRTEKQSNSNQPTPSAMRVRRGLASSEKVPRGHHTEFRWVVDKLDPKKPPETVTNVDDEYIAARQALVATLLGSVASMRRLTPRERHWTTPAIDEGRRKAVTRDLAMGRRLAPLEARLPALLAGTEQPYRRPNAVRVRRMALAPQVSFRDGRRALPDRV